MIGTNKYDSPKFGQEVIEIMENIEQLQFDIFKLEEITEGNALCTLGSYLMEKMDLFNKCDINPDLVKQFLINIQNGYENVPYHCKTHAADVTQMCYYFMTRCKMIEMCELSPLDILLLIIAPLCHDFEHNGHNNQFHVNIGSDLALHYNDQSVNENHHVAATFKIIKKSGCNILQNLSLENYIYFRKNMIQMILHTDMQGHFTDVAEYTKRIQSEAFNPKNIKDKEMLMRFALHLADIGVYNRSFESSKNWTDRITEETFKQVKDERFVGYMTNSMDQNILNRAKSATGFVDFILHPAYTTFCSVFENANECLTNMAVNKTEWLTLIDKYEEIKEKQEKEINEKLKLYQEEENLAEKKEMLLARLRAPPSSLLFHFSKDEI